MGDRQSVVWGLGYRLMRDQVTNAASLAFNPSDRDLELFSGFLQDEITLFPNRLKLTLGSKIEHNDYSGFEVEPSARLAWTPTARQTVWTAVSRAVRSPSRIDADEVASGVSTPNHAFNSEKVVAYELGYRVRPMDTLTLSAATYYNNYRDLRSFNYNTAPPPLLILSNAQKANAWGVELSAEWQATKSWRLRGGYTYLDKDITATNATVVQGSANFEADDPHNQVVVQSMMDLPLNLHLDITGRYVDMLDLPHSPSYLSADARLSWRYKNMEFSVVGQNLINTEHTEFGVSEIPRSVYGQVTFRY
jgi:iron complex outermembrane receptor protein